MAKLITITENGHTIESGWIKDEAKARQWYNEIRLLQPARIHVLKFNN